MTLDIDYTPPPTGERFMKSDAKMRVLMGPVGCVAPDTLVLTEYGPMPIWRIDRPMRVVSWNDKTCRFQLSWCGGAFPKGTDYLFQVTTPQGVFAANEHHRTYAAGHGYLPVGSLCPGQSLSLCSDTLALTKALCGQPLSLKDAPRSTRIAVDCLARYAESARQRGLQLLQEEGTDLVFAQALGGARTSASRRGWSADGRMGGLLEQLQEHTRRCLHDALSCIGGLLSPAAHLLPDVGGPALAGPYGRTVASGQQGRLSLQTSEYRPPEPQSSSCFHSLDIPSVSDGAIVSVARETVKRSYWDMQVLDTDGKSVV